MHKLLSVIISLLFISQAQALNLLLPPSNKGKVCQKLFSGQQQQIGSMQSLVPSDLLPAEFIKNIENAFGPVKLIIRDYTTSKIFKDIIDRHVGSEKLKKLVIQNLARENEIVQIEMLLSDGTTFLSVDMRFDRIDVGAVYISNLGLENPLNAHNRHHYSQEAKGFPFSVFKHAQGQLFKILKTSGFSKVKIDGANDYTVAMLYRRFLKAKPSNQKSIEYFKHLDYLFEYSKKSMSDFVDIKSADDFSKIIGNLKPTISKKFIAAEALYKKAGANEMPPEYLRLYDQNGQIIGFIDQANTYEKKNIYFIDPLSESRQFIHWSRLVLKNQTALEIEF